MTEILNLLQEGIHQNEDYAPLLLKALEDQHLLQHGNVSFSFKCKPNKNHQTFRFQVESNHYMTAKVNSLLNNQSTRNQAFVLLLKYLPECDLDVLNERGLVWLNTSIKTCAQKQFSDSTAKGFDVIRKFGYIPSFHRLTLLP